jgi:hypothetical protein
MGGVLRWGDRDMLQPSGGKRKEKYFKYYFFLLFVEEDNFLPLEQRVELKLDLVWYYNTMENQDVT